MFCHKCGTQIAEGAAFCHKCGTKVVYADTFQQPIDATVQTIESQLEMAQEISAVPVQADTAVNGENDFRRFLDSHVQATTAYLSAEELLNSHVPQRFVWVCFGVPAVLSIIGLLRSFSPMDLIAAPAFTLLVGYMAACLFDFIFTARITLQTSKNATKFSENLDTDDLLAFLNRQLAYLQPWFHEWWYIRRAGIGVGGTIAASAINAAAERANEITIGTGFGAKQKCFVQIYIKNDVTASNAGYSLGASSRAFAMWPAKYACIVKTATILQAAMEYYLRSDKQN